jgi:CRP-like cAMP-binding protein
MVPAAELRAIPLLSELGDGELEHIASACRSQKIAKGSFIVHVDDPGPSLFFLIEGEAKATLMSEQGKEIVLAYLAQGDFFGELALLTGEDRSANVVALSDSVVVSLPAEDFHRQIRENAGFAAAILRELAVRLRSATTKIGELALYDVTQRVTKTLQSMSSAEEKDGRQIWVISKRPTHQELAAVVGTSREMITRALRALEDEGLIVNEGRRIEIHRKLHP